MKTSSHRYTLLILGKIYDAVVMYVLFFFIISTDLLELYTPVLYVSGVSEYNTGT
jgi:hypothetical protein